MGPSAVTLSKAYKKEERKMPWMKPLRKQIEKKLPQGLGERIPYQECKYTGLALYEYRGWTNNRLRAFLAETEHGTWLLLTIQKHDFHRTRNKCTTLVNKALAE